MSFQANDVGPLIALGLLPVFVLLPLAWLRMKPNARGMVALFVLGCSVWCTSCSTAMLIMTSHSVGENVYFGRLFAILGFVVSGIIAAIAWLCSRMWRLPLWSARLLAPVIIYFVVATAIFITWRALF